MTKRQIFNIIKGTLLISIVGGIIWVKTREAEINRKWNNPEYQEKLRKQLSKKKDLFDDSDFIIEFKHFGYDINYLHFKTKLENPFSEYIEQSKLSLKLVLTYKKGTIKYTSKIKNSKPYDYQWDYFDFTDFFIDKNYTKRELRDVEYYTDLEDYYINEELKAKKKGDKYYYPNGGHNSIKDYKQNLSVSIEELKNFKGERKKELKKGFIDFEKYFYKKVYSQGHFMENKNYVFNTLCNINLRIFENFSQQNDTSDIDKIPTISLFKVEKAILEVKLNASNTNGFYFNDKVKSIDITDKWNDHFVLKKWKSIKTKKDKKEIYNVIKYKLSDLFQEKKSKADSIIGLKNDIFGKTEIKIAKSELVFQPKKKNFNLIELPDNTEINIRYSKNIFIKKLPNWNQNLSSETIESIVESIKKEQNSYYEKTKSNLKLNWLRTETGKINGNVFTKLTYLTKTKDDYETNEISYYIFFNVYENVIITYSRNVNNKPKWDDIFLESLETFDFRNKK